MGGRPTLCQHSVSDKRGMRGKLTALTERPPQQSQEALGWN